MYHSTKSRLFFLARNAILSRANVLPVLISVIPPKMLSKVGKFELCVDDVSKIKSGSNLTDVTTFIAVSLIMRAQRVTCM